MPQLGEVKVSSYVNSNRVGLSVIVGKGRSRARNTSMSASEARILAYVILAEAEKAEQPKKPNS